MSTITTLPPFLLSGGDSERGRIVAAGRRRSGRGVVDVGEAVVYRDHNTGRAWRVRVVPPQDADHTLGRISAASPVGAALVGLSEGESAEWKDRRGNRRTLHVLRIEDNIEPVGYINV